MDFHAIAAEHGITVILADAEYARKVGMPESEFEDRSFQCGKEVILGRHADPERLVASFFHELGHILDTRKHPTKLSQEVGAWETGFQLAEKHGASFGIGTLAWMFRQLASYSGNAD